MIEESAPCVACERSTFPHHGFLEPTLPPRFPPHAQAAESEALFTRLPPVAQRSLAPPGGPGGGGGGSSIHEDLEALRRWGCGEGQWDRREGQWGRAELRAALSDILCTEARTRNISDRKAGRGKYSRRRRRCLGA